MNDYKVSVEICSQVNELFSKTIVSQIFKNPDTNPLELKIYIYKKEDIIFSSFSAKIGDLIKVRSKVIKKEKAEEKYNDTIASGNAAIYVYEDIYNNRIILNMGNIPPKEEIELISEFIQLTESSNNYEFEIFRNLPIFVGRTMANIYHNVNLKGKIEIKTKDEIINIQKEILLENLEITEEIFNNKENYYLIKYKINELPKFENSRQFNYNDYIPSSKIYFDLKNENKNIFEPKIYYQKSNLIPNENSYILHLKNKLNNDNLKLNPALFIFLIDQSGSMGEEFPKKYSEKTPIKIVARALELFLKSLPVGSHYQLIGFGSNFKKYDEAPKIYTKENIDNSLKIIRSLNSDFGGTNIYNPLVSIYENEKEYDKIKLPKNIFLFTDGEIEDKKKTLELIEKYSSKFSIYSIGIGNSFDKELIKNAGIIGKGGFNFCTNLDNLNSIVVREINKCVKSYISNFHINCSLDKNNKIKVCDIPDIIRNNQIINIGYLTDNIYNKVDIEMNYFDKKKIKKKYQIVPNILENGEELSKLIICKYLSNEINNKEIESLSLKYQILTKDTSLFAEIELSEKITEKMKSEIIGHKNNRIIVKESIDESFFPRFVGKPIYYRSIKKEPFFPFLSNIFVGCCKNGEKIIKIEKESEINYEINNIKDNNKVNLEKIDDIMKIINTQDFIEGFWEYNQLTKFIKDKYLDKYNLIKVKLNSTDKISMTILIIYFIQKDHRNLLNELDLIIQKAKIYIKKETNQSYEESIKKIRI